MPTGTLTGVAHSVGSMTPSRSLHLSLAGVETSTGSLTPSMTRHATLAGLANNHGYSVGYKTFATPPSPLAAAGTPSGPAYGGGGLNDYRANPISFDLTHTSSTTGTITHVPVRSVTFSKAINKGCTWSAVASNIAAVPAFTSADVWRMSVSCMDVDNVPNIWQSPPLVAPERLNTVALSGLSQDIKGVDQTSWLLSTEGVSQPTLPFTSAAQVLFLLELMTGVSVVNPPNQALAVQEGALPVLVALLSPPPAAPSSAVLIEASSKAIRTLTVFNADHAAAARSAGDEIPVSLPPVLLA